jgi:hypothetical protein
MGEGISFWLIEKVLLFCLINRKMTFYPNRQFNKFSSFSSILFECLCNANPQPTVKWILKDPKGDRELTGDKYVSKVKKQVGKYAVTLIVKVKYKYTINKFARKKLFLYRIRPNRIRAFTKWWPSIRKAPTRWSKISHWNARPRMCSSRLIHTFDFKIFH